MDKYCQFDIVSHWFAILPIFLSYMYSFTFLGTFSAVTVAMSLVHHSYPDNNYLTHADEFFASTLIFLSFLVYVENTYAYAFSSILLLGGVVYFDIFVDVDLVTIFVGIVLFGGVSMFIYDKEIRKLKRSVYNIWNPYFISFIMTQLLAIIFYMWGSNEPDQPYAHSFWHVFAFVSFGSLVVHICPNKNEILNRVSFYWLGSVPCRLFIAWVFIDWDTASWESRMPVFIVFFILAAPILMKVRWKSLRFLISVLYVALVVLILFGHMYSAGWVLVTSTILSMIDWVSKNNILLEDLDVQATDTPYVVQDAVEIQTFDSEIKLRL